MRRLLVGRILAVVFLSLLVAGPALAAPPLTSESTTAPVGVMFNVGVNVLPNVQVVGDLGYNHKDGGSLTTFTGGARYLIPADPTGRISPFVEGLIGGGRIDLGFGSATGVAFGVGGGADIKAYQDANVRVQVNYFHTQKYGITFHEVRFGVGVSYGNKLFKAALGWAPSWLKASNIPLT